MAAPGETEAVAPDTARAGVATGGRCSASRRRDRRRRSRWDRRRPWRRRHLRRRRADGRGWPDGRGRRDRGGRSSRQRRHRYRRRLARRRRRHGWLCGRGSGRQGRFGDWRNGRVRRRGGRGWLHGNDARRATAPASPRPSVAAGARGNTPVCSNGTCVKRSMGDGCSVDAECGTGHCAQGSCCDSACDGQCESCKVAGSVGSCVPVTTPRTACAGTGTCAGFCDGTPAEPKGLRVPGQRHLLWRGARARTGP